MSKIITFGKEAREKLLSGVDIVANATKISLGPKGRNALIFGKHGAPQIINDGVSIAKEIELKDPLENAGAQLLKEVSAKTNDVAGDGTTTASVLAQGIIHNGLELLDNGSNPIQLREGINKAVTEVVNYIKEQAKPVDENTLVHVATISAGNNNEIGSLIAEALQKVGDDGIVTVEESNTIGINLKEAEGVKLDKGYISPHFITDNERMETVLEKPFVLLVNRKINLVQDVLPVVEAVAKQGGQLLLIAEDVEGEALAFLVVNTMRKALRCAAVKAPGFGDIRKNILHDIGVLTGATVWEEEIGVPLSDLNLQYLGSATRVIVKKDSTTIVVNENTKKEVEEHINRLKYELEHATSEYDKEKLQKRIAGLSGGVAVIEVGAFSDVELREKKLRIEDALNATKAAKEEGIVAGGGYTLLQAQKACNRTFTSEKFEKDYDLGYDLLINALSLPAYQIADNAGVNGDDVITNCKSNNIGYNALTNNYENLLETGIIDPAKVTRSALENAASIASMLLTTGVSIVEEPVTTDNGVFAPQGGMML